MRRKIGGVFYLPPDRIGSLVNGKDMTYPMPRPAFVIKTPLPHHAPRKNVKVLSRRTVKKPRAHEPKGALQHQGEILPLLFCKLAEGYCPCDIGSAGKICAAGIHQKKTTSLKRAFHLGSCRVVHEGSIFAVCRDRWK